MSKIFIMKFAAHLLLCLMIEFANTQFTSKRLLKTPCEIRGTALVEQFFNVVFAEFHQSPPSCTCVQMCADQPTYCYPNGCFKKGERKKETSPVSSIQHDAQTMFLINSDRDVFTDVIGNGKLMASSAAGNSEKHHQRPSKPHLIDCPNPFQKMVFKYKKIPKLQIKYNLREQIKHTMDKKAEVDVSKTRWPINTRINRQKNRQKKFNYLESVFPEPSQVETPKYFKKYLTKRENQNGSDISASYLYKDASNFSLETLIDNLIERGLEGANSTLELKISNSSRLNYKDNNEDTKLRNGVIEDLHKDTNSIAMEVLFIANATGNNNNSQNKDNSNNENSATATNFEMITTLSKQIEKQNNISMEVVGHMTGHRFGVITESANIINDSTSYMAESLLKTILNISGETVKSTTNRVPTSIHKSFHPVAYSQVKKSKQRIIRKLRNKKIDY